MNFAQGALGTLAAYVAFAELKAEYHVKTLPACLAGIVAAVAVSLLFQRLVLRTCATPPPSCGSSPPSACWAWSRRSSSSVTATPTCPSSSTCRTTCGGGAT